MFGSGALIVWMIAAQFFSPNAFNYTPLAIVVVANSFLVGVILSVLGVMSLYIRKIYSEVQNRPLFTVRETINL